jgi:hypothetical protein
MKPTNKIERLVKKNRYKANPYAYNKTLHSFMQAVDDYKKQKSTLTEPKIWRINMQSGITKFAAAAIIIVAVIIAINGLNGTSAWADVVREFNQAMSIHIVKIDTLTDDGIIRKNESWIKDQTRFRAQSHNWCVIDDGKQVLTLYEDQRIAHLRESLTPYWDYTPLILKVFRDGIDENGIIVTMLPEESDQDTHVYEISFRDYWQGKAWVDVASSLPVRIAGQESQEQGQTRDFEIVFDYEPIPDDVFITAIPPSFRELPRVTNLLYRQENKVLFGTVVDEQDNPVADARVYASYADPGRTDKDGKFSLPVPARDGSNSIGSVDFPMFVRAFSNNDPYSVAWTIIRYPHENEPTEYPIVERTHQGVDLIVEDEDELAQMLAGDLGQFSTDIDGNPKVKNIVLVMGPGSVITGRVTNDFDEPVSNATVWIEKLEIHLGINRLIVGGLGSEWQGKAFAVTDNDGYYELTNLPVPLKKIELKAKANGYAIAQQEFESNGSDLIEGCNLQLIEGASDVISAQIARYFGGIYTSRVVEESERFSEIQANGYPIKGSGNSIEAAVPADLHENLIVYYSFDKDDGTDVITDISGNELDGWAHGAKRINDEILGGTMSFDGNSDYIILPELYLKEFTFSAWVKTETLGLNNRRIFLLDDGSNYYAFQGNSRESVGIYVTEDIEINEHNLPLQVGQWTYLTVTYDADQIKIYRNGILTEMANGDFVTEGIEGKAYLGFSGKTGQDYRHERDHCWQGQIDEVAIFSCALTEKEVEQLFNMTGHADEEH